LTQKTTAHQGQWALVLGASSGFGAATAIELAKCGMNVFGVHLDTRNTLPNAQKIVSDIRALGRDAVFFNTNAADSAKRAEVLDKVQAQIDSGNGKGKVAVLLHSLAFGTLKPFIADTPTDAITQKQLDMTLDVMANSLVYWTQDLAGRNLLGNGSKIFAMTSAGSTRVWNSYGAVSAAKAALEAHVRQLAFELAAKGIAVNAIRAGVTDTPALRKIPGNDKLLKDASTRNPGGRLTTPQDVARAVAALCTDPSAWITGNVIGVDGGEDIVA